jgi:hypothetical protein
VLGKYFEVERDAEAAPIRCRDTGIGLSRCDSICGSDPDSPGVRGLYPTVRPVGPLIFCHVPEVFKAKVDVGIIETVNLKAVDVNRYLTDNGSADVVHDRAVVVGCPNAAGECQIECQAGSSGLNNITFAKIWELDL